jgi:hypothetical protein
MSVVCGDDGGSIAEQFKLNAQVIQLMFYGFFLACINE